MEPCVKLISSSNEIGDIIQNAKDWTLLNNLCKISNTDCNCNSMIIEHIPFSLFPSAIPKKLYLEVCEMAKILSELTHKVAHDYDFLKNALEESMKVDNFTKKSFDVYETVRKEGFTQKISLGIFRSDFLLDNQKSWKLVEINAHANGTLDADLITRLHKMISRQMGSEDLIKNMPDTNNNLEQVALGMTEAWKMYNDERYM